MLFQIQENFVSKIKIEVIKKAQIKQLEVLHDIIKHYY